MKGKIFILFETDLQKSLKSRVFLGAFDSENKAVDAVKENGCYSNITEVLILECNVNEFCEQ